METPRNASYAQGFGTYAVGRLEFGKCFAKASLINTPLMANTGALVCLPDSAGIVLFIKSVPPWTKFSYRHRPSVRSPNGVGVQFGSPMSGSFPGNAQLLAPHVRHSNSCMSIFSSNGILSNGVLVFECTNAPVPLQARTIEQSE